MSDFERPEDHGALGNGVHDDTAGFQAALNQAQVNGVPVQLTPGHIYLISDQLTIPNSVTINGLGARIVARVDPSNLIYAVFFSTGSNITIDNVYIEASAISDPNTLPGWHQGDPIGGADYGIWLEKGTGNTISRCQIQNTGQAGIVLHGVRQSSVLENRLFSCGRFHSVSGDEGKNDHGIMVYSDDEDPVLDIAIDRNVVLSARRKGITTYVGPFGAFVQQVSISGNKVYSCGLSGIFVASDLSRTDQPQSAITIFGNVLRDNGVTSGTSFEVALASAVTVMSNTSIGNRYGIHISRSRELAITGNVIRDCTLAAIHVSTDGVTSNIAISGNSIVRPCSASAGVGPALSLNTQDATVVGNSIIDDQNHMTYGVQFVGTYAADNIAPVSANRIVGHITAPVNP